MAWKKGQSGNPSGRVLDNVGGYNIPQLCRIASKDALDVLKSIMKNEEQPASARVKAAEAIWDRGLGKAPTTSIAPQDLKDALNLSDAELAAIATGSSESAAEETPGPSQLN